MPTNFPGSADSFPAATPTSPRNNPSLSTLITNIGDAVEALEAKVGTNSSDTATSLDYILKSTVGGHDHDGSDSKRVAYTSLTSVPSTFSPSTHSHGTVASPGIHGSIGADDHHAEVHGPAKHTFSGAKMTNTGGQSTSTGTAAALDATATAFDSGSYADLAANRFNVPVAGYYRVTARATFPSDASGYRRLRILLDGSTALDVDQRFPVSGDATTVSCQWVGSLGTSNKVSADLLQTAGRNLTVSSSSIDIQFLGTA